ncbi:MAG: hypothetical protein M1834_002091 [Cirrosporium novae-zelandiae]|nr:MAG: hypothetical protein M1834_002091 [Cirrosporium novae-zelandiae]
MATNGRISSHFEKLQLSKLADPENEGSVCPVIFSWDYLPDMSSFLITQDWTFENPIDQNRTDDKTYKNAFPIYPKAANLPFHTGLTTTRHNRFWKAALDASAELCELLANDQSFKDAKLTSGGTLASIAGRDLQKPEGERFIKFAINLFPQANEERMQLIAAGIMFVVIFDDSWEEAPGEALKRVQDDFVSRLRHDGSTISTESSPLQARIDNIIQRFHTADKVAGNGGQDVIDTMLDWILHSQPEKRFDNVREYLDYRWGDAANAWLFACSKFSIESDVNLSDPKLAPFLRLAGDNISLVNDLASFDKELRAFESGKTVVLINAVDVVRRACGLSIPDAKATTYTLQLLNEDQIRKELERMKVEDKLTLEEWKYVDAILVLLAGNTFYSMTTSRYGGEAARIVRS